MTAPALFMMNNSTQKILCFLCIAFITSLWYNIFAGGKICKYFTQKRDSIMKKLFAVLLAALILVGVPAVYAAVEDHFTEYCSLCEDWTSWTDDVHIFFTPYDDEYHLVEFVSYSYCTDCHLVVFGPVITDSLESHSFNEDGICEVCNPQEN